MRLKKNVTYLCLVLIGCGTCFVAGREVSRRGEAHSQSPSRPEALTPFSSGHVSNFAALILDEEAELQVSTGADRLALRAERAKGEQSLDFLVLYDEKQKPVLVALLYPNGSVKEVRISAAGEGKFARGFYEEGSLRFTSTFERMTSHTVKELRQHYERDGKPAKKEILMLNSVD